MRHTRDSRRERLRYLPFATEFPVKKLSDSGDLVGEIVTWLRGNPNSTVLSTYNENLETENESGNQNVYLESDSGEELRLRELRHKNNWIAVGFRHDYPDEEDRLWSTECVLKRGKAKSDQDIIHFRTLCLAKTPSTTPMSPRKPFIIKNILKKQWGGLDHKLNISDQPVWLQNNEDDIAIASAVTLGKATKWLPTVYISSIGKNVWPLTKTQIENLTYGLGGVAHVVVEPNRQFSFLLRDECNGKNVYYGAIGISVPERGIVRRCFPEWPINKHELMNTVQTLAISLREQMPSSSWDWTELTEKALRAQNKASQQLLSAKDFEELTNQIKDLQNENQELREQLTQSVESKEANIWTDNLAQYIGPEIYPGEISDRLRLAANRILSNAEAIGIDSRSKIVFERIAACPPTLALKELLNDIERATGDTQKILNHLPSLLARLGYQKKSENRHVKFEATQDYNGLETIIVPKTPSDHRATKNLRNDIQRTLGINKLLKLQR